MSAPMPEVQGNVENTMDTAMAPGALVPAEARGWRRLFGPLLRTLLRWFDTSFDYMHAARDNLPDHIDWARILPFVLMHVACMGALWVGVSPIAVIVAVIAYVVRMFAITGFYHRYFSHRTFKTSRPWQFIFGMLGASAVQR